MFFFRNLEIFYIKKKNFKVYSFLTTYYFNFQLVRRLGKRQKLCLYIKKTKEGINKALALRFLIFLNKKKVYHNFNSNLILCALSL